MRQAAYFLGELTKLVGRRHEAHFALLGFAFAVACSNHHRDELAGPRGTNSAPRTVPTTKKINAMTTTPCAQIRNAIETRNFQGWKGLPDSCQANQLFDNMPSDLSERPRRRLGSRSAVWVLVQLDGYYRQR